MKTIRDWSIVTVLFSVAIRIAAWLVTPVLPLITSLAILIFVVTTFISRSNQ